MKKKILCTCLSVLVVAVSLWLVPVETQALSLTASWSEDRALPGEDVTVTVSLSEEVLVKSGLFTVTYDSAQLELVSSQWLLDAPIADFDMQNGRGVFISEQATTLGGDILALTFRAKEGAQNGPTTVTCIPELRDDQDAEIVCASVEGSVYIGYDIASYKMRPIKTAYQYVSSAEDSSSLSGMAEPGSAIYMYKNTLRTAFRVPASYETDTEDFSTIVLNGDSFPIVERGIILGVAGQELTIDSPFKVSTQEPFREKYWTYDEENRIVTYTALVKNVTIQMLDTAYIARSYVKIEVDGEVHVVYSDTSVSFTPQKLYDATVKALEAQGQPAPRWFTDPSIDDGVIELD